MNPTMTDLALTSASTICNGVAYASNRKKIKTLDNQMNNVNNGMCTLNNRVATINYDVRRSKTLVNGTLALFAGIFMIDLGFRKLKYAKMEERVKKLEASNALDKQKLSLMYADLETHKHKPYYATRTVITQPPQRPVTSFNNNRDEVIIDIEPK